MGPGDRPVPRFGWARCRDNVADILRRGAWYPILEEEEDHVVLEVRRQRIRLSRNDVKIRLDPPTDWSIVVRTGVLRPTLGGGKEVVTTYAVCPHCHERQIVDTQAKPREMRCNRCHAISSVEWGETC